MRNLRWDLDIKLAVLHHAFGRFGGGEKLAILHAINLKSFGFEVELFYNGPILDDWSEKALSEIPVHPLPFGIPHFPQKIKEITEFIRRLRWFDVVLVHHHIDPFLAYYLTCSLRSKLVWYCGEPLRALWEDRLSGISYKELKTSVIPTSISSYGEGFTSIFLSKHLYSFSIAFLRSLDRVTARSYRKIIANSHYTREVITKLYDLDTMVEVVYPGVDSAGQKYFHGDEGLGDYILSVASMIPMKNHVNLLNAFYLLTRECEREVGLVIIGSGPLEDRIRSMVHKLKLKDVVIRSDVAESELANYYRRCRFIVHQALYEPFGLVPVEAALFGKPSIVSEIGGTRETVIDGETGFRVDPDNPKSIADAMRCLIEDENLVIEMGIKARERALNNFTIERSTKNLARALHLNKD